MVSTTVGGADYSTSTSYKCRLTDALMIFHFATNITNEIVLIRTLGDN